MLQTQPTSPPRSGHFGIYRIESLIARGGMGEVYLAWDPVLERHVAIKRVRDDRLGDPKQQARFLREARTAASLDHPAIVRIYHVMEWQDGHCLVMEYVRGQDLGKLIAAGQLGMQQLLALGRDIAEGLGAAHAQGLIHRDLKPANVMVLQSVQPFGRAKILDFGLSKPFVPCLGAQQEDDLTQSGLLVGTAHAMSPEQALGQPLDHRSDLFSLGSLLYEMVAGRAPFRGGTVFDTLQRITSEVPTTLTEVRPEVPAPLADLVDRLLAKDPDHRPQNSHLVVQELAALTSVAVPEARRQGEAGKERDAVGSAAVGPAIAEPVQGDAPTLSEGRAREEGKVLARGSDPARSKPASSKPGSSVLRVLVSAVLVSESPGVELVDSELVELSEPHDQLMRQLLARHAGLPIEQGRGLLAIFERPGDAVAFALAYQRDLDPLLRGKGLAMAASVGVHLAEVDVGPSRGDSLALDQSLALDHSLAPDNSVARDDRAPEIEMIENGAHENGILARRTAQCLSSLAAARQILLTRGVFDLARGSARAGELADPQLRWLQHGSYHLQGFDQPLEICEVGIHVSAPLAEPPNTEWAKRGVSPSAELTLGWRPAVGQAVPRRHNWELVRRLGRGGFGEVWLARHKSGEERVFKFCLEAEQLRPLKREVTLFRILREALGHRHDIARVLDWDFDQAPYFLESEYTDGGDLVSWAERRGGLAAVPLARRLELVAGVAEALAAAHSVGVLHKDVKPRNVLVAHDPDGRPQARLADFGIGALTRGAKEPRDFTVQGLTQPTGEDADSQGTGTQLYLAPELLTGEPATVQADVYSLGLVLYQAVVGDFHRPLAPGWRRDIDDELLVEDIAACVDGASERRLRSAAELADRLRTLEQRRNQRRAELAARKSRQRALRRRRLAAILAAASVVLLLVVSIFALQTLRAKNRELEAREAAQLRRQQAEDLIDFMLGDLRKALEPIGRLDILGRIGDQAMAYFGAVPRSELSEKETATYAQSLHQIGQVRFQLGDLSEASESFAESLAMAQELAARDPADADHQFGLGQSHFWLGYLRWQEGNYPAALEQFEAYRQISQALVDRDPENETWRRELAYSYSNLGSLYEKQGELPEAALALAANARILEELSLESPEDHQLGTSLAMAYGKLGRVSEERGELAFARGRYEASVGILQRMTSAKPNNADLQHSINRGHFHLGRVLLLQGETSLALERFRTALDHSRRLVALEPENLDWLASQSVDLMEIARVLMSMGEMEEAAGLLAERVDITRQLLQHAPQHVSWRFHRARDLWGQAHLQLHLGRPTTAIGLLQRALAILQELVDESDSLVYRIWWVRVCESLGNGYQSEGNATRAFESWSQGLEMAEQLVAAKPSPIHLEALARMLVLVGQRDEARAPIGQLAAMGYGRLDYQAFLARHGLAGA